MVQDDDNSHNPVTAPLETCTFTVIVVGIDYAGTFVLAVKCFALEMTHITFAYLGMEASLLLTLCQEEKGKPEVGDT